MSDRDPIVDLFESKLRNAEFEVDPSVWTNIASQIPAMVGTTASTGISLTSKIIITSAVAATAVIATVVIYVSNNKEEQPTHTPLVKTEEIISVEEQPTFSNNSESPLIKTDDVLKQENNVPVDTYQEGVTETVEQPLTILDVDKIIDKDQIVEQDNLIVEFIDTPQSSSLSMEEQNESQEESIEFESEEQKDFVEIKIPNVFTPNNDGHNDVYFVTFEGVINNVSVVIFNNTGEVVFRSSDPDFKWDGRNMLGDPCLSGKYIFMMTGEDQNGNEVLKNGDFQLLR